MGVGVLRDVAVDGVDIPGGDAFRNAVVPRYSAIALARHFEGQWTPFAAVNLDSLGRAFAVVAGDVENLAGIQVLVEQLLAPGARAANFGGGWSRPIAAQWCQYFLPGLVGKVVPITGPGDHVQCTTEAGSGANYVFATVAKINQGEHAQHAFFAGQ